MIPEDNKIIAERAPGFATYVETDRAAVNDQLLLYTTYTRAGKKEQQTRARALGNTRQNTERKKKKKRTKRSEEFPPRALADAGQRGNANYETINPITRAMRARARARA